MTTREIIIIGLAIVGIISIYLYDKKKTEKRINELISMIENLNQLNYQINMNQDQFSKLEDQIYKLFLIIIEERENIEKIYKSQSRNLEDIAHQIKTPITAMLFQLENMEKDGRDDLGDLKNQLVRINKLTQTLLKISSLEANINKMKKETIDLGELIDYSLDILSANIADRQVEIRKGKIQGQIVGDYYWLGEALINIIDNGLRVSQGGSLEIKTAQNPIYSQISILDSGGGINEKDKRKIFQRFYKTPDSDGFGLGLSMAKTIIEANNGEIQVENKDQGAEFKIKFYNVT